MPTQLDNLEHDTLEQTRKQQSTSTGTLPKPARPKPTIPKPQSALRQADREKAKLKDDEPWLTVENDALWTPVGE